MNFRSQHRDFVPGLATDLAAPVSSERRTILLVENDVDLSRFLILIAESHGYLVQHTQSGTEAMAMIASARPDIVLLDWSIEGISGIEVCRRLRSDPDTRSLAVIMISGRGDEDDRIHGLTSGADDYLVKPFSSTELFARAKAILRRRGSDSVEETVSYGDIVLDTNSQTVSRAGKIIPLRPREFHLLRHLISRPCRLVSHEQLLHHVWGGENSVDCGAIAQAVSRLRRALHIDGLSDPIRTVRAAGYSLDFERAVREPVVGARCSA